MAAVSSSKWTSFYNDPPPLEFNEDDVTSTGEFVFWMFSVFNSLPHNTKF